MPKVSIIVPVYNVEKYLEKCLNSLINQTFKDIEIICVDDCSTDSSYSILLNYQNLDSRIKVIKLNKNSQLGAARNAGMKIAKGKYITFIDSDDYLDSTFVQKMYEKAEENNSDIVISNIKNYTLDESQNLTELRSNLDKYYESVTLQSGVYKYHFNFFKQLRVGAVAKLYKKNIIDKYNIRFPEHLIQEDEAFYWFYMIRVRSVYYINEELYYRLVHSTSIMFNLSYKNERCFDYLKILHIIYDYLIKSKLYKRYKKKFKLQVIRAINNIQNPIIRFFYIIKAPDFINIIPNLFFQNLRRDFSLFKYLRLYQNKKIMFWGASLYLNKFLSKYYIHNKSILGIIDKNPKRKGEKIKNYEIFSPKDLDYLNPDIIIITIVNFNTEQQIEIKKYIKENFNKNIKIVSINGM